MKIRGKGHLATKTNGLNGLNEVKKNPLRKAKRKVRHFCFIRIICLLFLWARLSIGFGTKWPLFMTVSWRLLLLNVLGNVTDSLLLCNAAGPPGMSTLCWKLYYTFHSLVLATYKKSFRRISHYILFSSIFFLPPIKLNDFSNSRANKRHFENFDQILLTVTLS